MKALVLHQLNEYPRLTAVAMPEVHAGERLVHIKAAALNHRDIWIIKGMYAGIKYPTILGSDGVGEVDGKLMIINPNIGWGEDDAAQSKAYNILGLPKNGTFAQYVSVAADKLFPIPGHLTALQAAALPIAGMTAYRALFTKCKLKAGQNVLITGIGGGVALMAMQMAMAAGANVYVTSGQTQKIEKAINLGAKGGANYKDPQWVATLQEQAGGFHCIIDSAAGEGFAAFPKLCYAGANICFYGGTQGNITQLNPQQLFWKQITLHGSTMSTDTEFVAMLQFVANHQLIPIIDKVIPYTESDTAFKRLANSQQFGKIVLNWEE